MYENIDADSIDQLIFGDKLADGGAAMTAYSRMQFTEMTDIESREIQKALLKYCELDTLAMVWEYWAREIFNS